jgi:hypothetical protein
MDRGKGQWVRAVPDDCTAQNVDWKAFLNGRPDAPFDPFKFLNWGLYWMFSGGNITENMVHQMAWIMSALDLPLPTAAYMSGGVFSEKEHYYSEDVNRPNDTAIKGERPSQNHIANWIDCMRSRKTPNASVELGYRSAVVAHMANLSYRHKRRLTLEEAKATQPEF